MIFLVVLLAGSVIASCAPKARTPLSQLDTPEHHAITGIKFLNQAKYLEAQREFNLAIELDPKYSKAYAGRGLVKAYQGDFKAAFDSMKSAWKYANTNDEKVFVHTGNIRLYTMSRQDKDWLKQARAAFDDAIEIDPKSSAAYYYIGIAYKTGLEFSEAGKMFTKVLDLNGDYMQEADSEWKTVQKIQRAMPGTLTGKKIAIVDAITRADVAALFMEELKIDRLYEKRAIKTFDTSFKDPEKAKSQKAAQKFTSTDIADHPLKADVEGILAIGVRGLENYPDGAFHPGELITKAAYAMMIEDILIKLTGDQNLATRFIGSASPFPDLRPDLPYFNAVMVVTSRGIMEPKDFTTGEFAPMSSVSGADALLVIRKIKEELKF
ncbi:MAG: tetratricopeptide repeat protein [Syntrophales bacterium]